MKKQKCPHPDFYTMEHGDAFCSECHEYLGYFDSCNFPFGFVKKTKDKIKDEYINEEINRRICKNPKPEN